MKAKRKCILCPSHEYEYCGKCKPSEVVETWRYIFDSENCRDVYKILENYVAKKITADDAKIALSKLSVPNKEDMQPALKQTLEDIYLKATREIKNISEPQLQIKEESIISMIENEKHDDAPKPRRRRSRRNVTYDI